jgi:hypothetical protein
MTINNKAFMSCLNDITYRNPLNPSEMVFQNIAAIEAREFDGVIRISSIRSFERNKKHGAMALKALTTLADELNVTLALFPKAFDTGDKGLSTSQLKKWYARNGFKAIEFGDMVRQPVKGN